MTICAVTDVPPIVQDDQLTPSSTKTRIRLESFSKDPIGFNAGDANLYRYVGNGPTGATDPSGLEKDKREWAWYSLPGLSHFFLGWTGIGKAIDNDIEANSKRLDNLEYQGRLTSGGNFHCSDGTKAAIAGLASYPIYVAMLSPGLEDLANGPAAKWLAGRGLSVMKNGGEWVLKSRAGKVVGRGVDDVMQAIAKLAPRTRTTYGKNALGHFRSHSQHIRETARKLGIDIPKRPTKPTTLAAMKAFLETVVQEGAKKTAKCMNVAGLNGTSWAMQSWCDVQMANGSRSLTTPKNHR